MLYLAGGLVLGETMALLVTGKREIFGLAAMLAVLVCLVLRVYVQSRERDGRGRSALLGLILLAAAGTSMGFLRMEYEERRAEREEKAAGEWENGDVRVIGTVEEIEEREKGFRILLGSCACEAEEGPRKVYCYVEEDAAARMQTGSADGSADIGKTRLRPGMRILAEGRGKAPEPARNPGSFDYRLYCRARGITGILYGERTVILDGRYWPVRDAIRRLRLTLSGKLDQIAEDGDAGILKAVLLGIRSDMDDGVYELYRRNGISHLLAISGLHVSMIGMGLWKTLRRCGLSYGAAGAVSWGILLGYGVMTGFGPSVVRAVFMSGISFLAAWVGRTYDLPSAMCIPAMGLLLASPYLLTQSSFQLSFLAVGAVFFPGGYLAEKWRAGGVFQAFLMSASIQAVTAPAILYHTFELPVYSVALNLLVIPLMSFVVFSGSAGMLMGFLIPELGMALLGGAHYILRLYEGLGNVFLGLPGACAVLGRPEWRQIAVYYGGLLLGLWLACRERIAGREGTADRERIAGREKIAGRARNLVREKLPGQRLLPVLVWAASFLCLLPVRESGLLVTFLDVGQGDGIVLESGECTVLVDCGSSQERNLGENCLVPYLKSRGITRVDTAVVSHGDLDHISGIRYLLDTPGEGITVGVLVMPEAGRGKEIYAELEASAAVRGTRVVYAKRGDTLSGALGKETDIFCLHPPEGEIYADRNEESLVLLVELGDFRLLLTGDVEDGGEEELLESGVLGPVTVLKAAHHGSSTSSGDAFVETAAPKAVVVSYGLGNRYGHPNEEVMERFSQSGAKILETARMGAVRIWTDGHTMRIRGYLGGP